MYVGPAPVLDELLLDVVDIVPLVDEPEVFDALEVLVVDAEPVVEPEVVEDVVPPEPLT